MPTPAVAAEVKEAAVAEQWPITATLAEPEAVVVVVPVMAGPGSMVPEVAAPAGVVAVAAVPPKAAMPVGVPKGMVPVRVPVVEVVELMAPVALPAVAVEEEEEAAVVARLPAVDMPVDTAVVKGAVKEAVERKDTVVPEGTVVAAATVEAGEVRPPEAEGALPALDTEVAEEPAVGPEVPTVEEGTVEAKEAVVEAAVRLPEVDMPVATAAAPAAVRVVAMVAMPLEYNWT